MLDFLYTVMYLLVIVSSAIYVWHKLLYKNIDFKNPKLYIIAICTMIMIGLNTFITNKYLKMVSVTIIIMFFFKLYFKESLHKCIVTAIFYEFLMIISETIFAIIITMLKIDISITITSTFVNMISNFIIALISVFILNFKIVKILYKKILNFTDNIKSFQLLMFCFIIMFIANILIMSVYYKIKFQYLLLFNVGMTLVCFILTFYSFRTKNNYNKVYDKYNTTLNSLKEYEDILDKYRVSNHENKNQLLTIRNMVVDKNKKVAKYIDEIVNNKLKDDEKIMKDVSIIPAGGLRGLVYSKVLYMKENKIKYELNISKEIKTVALINKLDSFDILDICKIIGVYMDNAIQEVTNLKNKYISIDMYLENKNLVFEISNNYTGKIELDKLEQNGYTTKGSGHGYGLPLTKEIINKNSKLKNEKRLSKDFFTQVLKIKMK